MTSVMNNTNDFEFGGDRTNPRLDSISLGNRESSSVHLTRATSDNVRGIHGGGKVAGSVEEGGTSSGNGSDVSIRGPGDSNESRDFEFDDDTDVFSDRNQGMIKNGKHVQQQHKGRGREIVKSISPLYDSTFDEFAANGSVAVCNHKFEVGDMVWGKVKSHPWWPGHVYSEEFATPSVRRSKRDGLLLVAFFGDSSYGWFDPSELMPFDCNFAEKSRQTNSRTFVKAVEEAVDEVSRRRGLGLSCMCRNKQSFRPTGVEGFFAVDVADYEPGAVYSVDVIAKARNDFQPSLALDFVRQLALAPTESEHAGIKFLKNKATVMSYRKATYEEFDDTYAQAFGQQPDRPLPGSVQELPSGKTRSKAPLSGRQVFADTSGKGKSSAKPYKPKGHAKNDKYLFKRRDEAKDVKMHPKNEGQVTSSLQPAHIEDSLTTAAGDYVLQKRAPATYEQTGTTARNGETGVIMEDTPTTLKYDNPCFQMSTIKVESHPSSSAGEAPLGYSNHLSERGSVDEESRVVPEMDSKANSASLDDRTSNEAKVLVRDDISSSTLVAMQRENSGQKSSKVLKRPIGEEVTEKSVLPDKKKKIKKELSDSAQLHGKEGVSLVGRVSANKPVQPTVSPKPPLKDPQRKLLISSSSDAVATQEMTGNHELVLRQTLGDLQALALDPFHAIEKRRPVKTRRVFLRFRSLLFQKSLALSPQAEDETSDTPEDGKEVPLLKPQARPYDPTKDGRKRGPSDRQQELAAKKKKKVNDIRYLTADKLIKKNPEAKARGDVKQATITTPRKTGPEFIKKTEQRAPEPTMVTMKFPPGGYLPSVSELKARFARYGPMDPSATRVFWNTFTCRLVYRNKADAQDAYKFVIGSSTLFGNTDVKCHLKEVGVAGSVESEPPVLKAPKEDIPSGAHHPSAVVATPGLQLKSCLKKSGGEEVGSNVSRGRVKFLLGVEESSKNNLNNNNNATSIGDGAASSSSSNATIDFNSKNFQKAILQPPLPIPNTTRPPLSPIQYGTDVAPPLTRNVNRPITAPPPKSNVDITQHMLSLLTKCNDVVTNVTGLLGYVPYHPL